MRTARHRAPRERAAGRAGLQAAHEKRIASCAESPPAGNAMRVQALSLLVARQVDHRQRYHRAAMGTEAMRFPGPMDSGLDQLPLARGHRLPA